MHLRLHFRRCQECLQGFVALSPGRQSVVLLAGHGDEPSPSWESHCPGKGLALLPNLPAPLQLWPKSKRWQVVLFGFTPRKQQEQKGPFRASQVTVRTRNSLWVLACTSWVQSNDCLDQKLVIFLLLTKAVSAETSFLPGIVYAVWETSLKYIGKRLPLFCQYKPCLH